MATRGRGGPRLTPQKKSNHSDQALLRQWQAEQEARRRGQSNLQRSNNSSSLASTPSIPLPHAPAPNLSPRASTSLHQSPQGSNRPQPQLPRNPGSAQASGPHVDNPQSAKWWENHLRSESGQDPNKAPSIATPAHKENVKPAATALGNLGHYKVERPVTPASTRNERVPLPRNPGDATARVNPVRSAQINDRGNAPKSAILESGDARQHPNQGRPSWASSNTVFSHPMSQRQQGSQLGQKDAASLYTTASREFRNYGRLGEKSVPNNLFQNAQSPTAITSPHHSHPTMTAEGNTSVSVGPGLGLPPHRSAKAAEWARLAVLNSDNNNNLEEEEEEEQVLSEEKKLHEPENGEEKKRAGTDIGIQDSVRTTALADIQVDRVFFEIEDKHERTNGIPSQPAEYNRVSEAAPLESSAEAYRKQLSKLRGRLHPKIAESMSKTTKLVDNLDIIDKELNEAVSKPNWPWLESLLEMEDLDKIGSASVYEPEEAAGPRKRDDGSLRVNTAEKDSPTNLTNRSSNANKAETIQQTIATSKPANATEPVVNSGPLIETRATESTSQEFTTYHFGPGFRFGKPEFGKSWSPQRFTFSMGKQEHKKDDSKDTDSHISKMEEIVAGSNKTEPASTASMSNAPQGATKQTEAKTSSPSSNTSGSCATDNMHSGPTVPEMEMNDANSRNVDTLRPADKGLPKRADTQSSTRQSNIPQSEFANDFDTDFNACETKEKTITFNKGSTSSKAGNGIAKQASPERSTQSTVASDFNNKNARSMNVVSMSSEDYQNAMDDLGDARRLNIITAMDKPEDTVAQVGYPRMSYPRPQMGHSQISRSQTNYPKAKHSPMDHNQEGNPQGNGPQANVPHVSQLLIDHPPMTQPLANPPSVRQPAVSQPAASQPAASKPAVSQPVASQPAVIQPAVIQPPVILPRKIQEILDQGIWQRERDAARGTFFAHSRTGQVLYAKPNGWRRIEERASQQQWRIRIDTNGQVYYLHLITKVRESEMPPELQQALS